MNAEEQSDQAIENQRRKQRVVNAAHRCNADPNFKIVREYFRKLFRVGERRFTPVLKSQGVYGYDPLAAALADGATAWDIEFEKLLGETPQGDANHTKPKAKVRKS